MISFSRTTPFRTAPFARGGKKWINRCVFCYYCNALLDPSSLHHPADDELELLQCVAGIEDEPQKPRRRNGLSILDYFFRRKFKNTNLVSEKIDKSPKQSAPYVSDHYFEQKLMPHLMDLTGDSITNVKICAVRTLKNIVTSRPHFQNKESESESIIVLHHFDSEFQPIKNSKVSWNNW